MQDLCVQIYDNSDDVVERTLKEELACHDRCKTVSVYKNSCMLTVHRLRKEIDQSKNGESSNLISHADVLAGKTKGSWSVVKPNKVVTDFKGLALYQKLEKWILTSQQLKDNGFPRPHPDGGKVSIIFVHKKFVSQFCRFDKSK